MNYLYLTKFAVPGFKGGNYHGNELLWHIPVNVLGTEFGFGKTYPFKKLPITL